MSLAPHGDFRLIRDRLDFYRKHSEDWKDDHDEAMACFELEELVAAGIETCEAINRADEWQRSRVASGQAKYAATDDNKIVVLYRHWMRGSEIVLDILTRFEKRFEVRRAKKFRRCYREVVGILTPDEKFFVEDALVKLRDDAMDAHRRGETVEIKDLSD